MSGTNASKVLPVWYRTNFFFQLMMQRFARRLEEDRTICDTAPSASSGLQTGASVLQRQPYGGRIVMVAWLLKGRSQEKYGKKRSSGTRHYFGKHSSAHLPRIGNVWEAWSYLCTLHCNLIHLWQFTKHLDTIATWNECFTKAKWWNDRVTPGHACIHLMILKKSVDAFWPSVQRGGHIRLKLGAEILTISDRLQWNYKLP